MSYQSDTDAYEDSLWSWASEPQSLIINWRGWKKTNASYNGAVGATSSSCASHDQSDCEEQVETKKQEVLPLVELSAQAVAQHIPFEVVEMVNPPVPEQLHLRIAFWSFPDSEEDIRLYSCLANGSAELYQRAEEMLRKNAVRDLLQIGFHLSATVCGETSSNPIYANEVSLTFDRKRIITCNCTCSQSSWCPHVIAVCLARITRPEEVKLRAPISESLSRLQRDQLQKFAQYLISELPKQILPTAQRLLDDLLSNQQSTINTLRGAPDPTAGASIHEKTSWFLDASMLHENIRKILLKLCIPTPIVISDVSYLSSAAPPAASEWATLLRPLRGKEPEGIWNLMAIVREMMKRGDENAVSLLRIVTQEIMDCSQIINWWFNVKSNLNNVPTDTTDNTNQRGSNGMIQNTLSASQHACASLCEEIVVLWRLACLNPRLSTEERREYFDLLKSWHVKVLDTSNRSDRNMNENYYGFKPALEACLIDWTDFFIPGVSTLNKSKPNSEEQTTDFTIKPDKINVKLANCSNSSNASGFQAYVNEEKCLEKISSLDAYFVNPQISKSSDADIKASSSGESVVDPPSQQVSEAVAEGGAEGAAVLNNELSVEERLNALYKFKHTKTNVKFVCSSANNVEKSYTIVVRKISDQHEIDFMRAEALYAHGLTDQACELSVRLAEDMLENPPRMTFDLEQLNTVRQKRSKAKFIPLLRQHSLAASAVYSKLAFLCKVLSEHSACHDLAVRIGLIGLQFERPPAPIKSLEVKLINQEQDLVMLLKKIPLQAKQMRLLRQKAIELRDGVLPSRGAVLPLMLSSYIFDALVLSTVEEGGMEVTDRMPGDEQLAFSAAVAAIGMKSCISEADYPLLCEGIRRQRGDLAMSFLLHYKDDETRLVKIMKKLLDRSLYRRNGHCVMNCVGACICGTCYYCVHCNVHLQNQQPTNTLESPVSRALEQAQQSFVRNNLQEPIEKLDKLSKALSCACNWQPGDLRPLWVAQARAANNNHNKKKYNNNHHNNNNYNNFGSHNNICNYNNSTHINSGNHASGSTIANASNIQAENSSHQNANIANSPQRRALIKEHKKVFLNSHHTIKANAHFMFELAKSVLAKAGGNNCTVSLFRQPFNNDDAAQVPNKQLHICAFQLGLYSLGLFNSVSNTWCMRTYSSHVSWICTQAMEIGPPALSFLISTWRGHLTPFEVAALADRASRGFSASMITIAAKLALSALAHASSLNQNEIQRALIQCKEQSDEMYMLGLEAVEIAGRQGGIGFEMLFDIARKWSELAEIERAKFVKRKEEETKRTRSKKKHSDSFSSSTNVPHGHAEHQAVQLVNPDTNQSPPGTMIVQSAPPFEVYAIRPPFANGYVANMPTIQSVLLPSLPSSHQLPSPTNQSHKVPLRFLPAPLPTNVSALHVPYWQWQTPPTRGYFLPNIMPTANGWVPAGPPSSHSSSPHLALPPPRMNSPRGPTSPASPSSPVGSQPPLPAQMQPLLPQAPQMHMATQLTTRPPILHFDPRSGMYVQGPSIYPSSGIHIALPAGPLQIAAPPQQPLVGTYPEIAAAGPLVAAGCSHEKPFKPLEAHQVHLLRAYRVGLVAMEKLSEHVSEEKPRTRFARFTPYGDDVKWLFTICKKLGMEYVQEFCSHACVCIRSPFVLHEIIDLVCEWLTAQINIQDMQVFSLPLVRLLVQKCQHMYVAYLYYHIHQITGNEYESFCHGIVHAKIIFEMEPDGTKRFIKTLGLMKRKYSTNKTLWKAVHEFFPADDIINTDPTFKSN